MLSKNKGRLMLVALRVSAAVAINSRVFQANCASCHAVVYG